MARFLLARDMRWLTYDGAIKTKQQLLTAKYPPRRHKKTRGVSSRLLLQMLCKRNAQYGLCVAGVCKFFEFFVTQCAAQDLTHVSGG